MNYLPSFNENSCISLDYLESNFIRVYESTPTADASTNYIDYFPKMNYYSRSGSQYFDTVNVNCSDHQNFTDDFYYRIDFVLILIIFAIFFFFIILVPLKIWSKLFRKGSL